jgi:O-antigen ligase
VQASDQLHAGFISQALQVVHTQLAIGNGLATEAETAQNTQFQSAITDGSLLATFAECGLVGLVAYGVLIGATVRALWQRAQTETPGQGLAVGLLAYTAYQFGFASFVDSGYFGKSPFVVYWLLVGTVLSAAAVTPSDPGSGRYAIPSTDAGRAGHE